jgi:hypothetical protein
MRYRMYAWAALRVRAYTVYDGVCTRGRRLRTDTRILRSRMIRTHNAYGNCLRNTHMYIYIYIYITDENNNGSLSRTSLQAAHVYIHLSDCAQPSSERMEDLVE